MSRRRRAFTMIEAIVVVAMSGIVLLTGISLIHLILGVQRTTQTSVHLSTSGSNLSRLFRQDVHGATRLETASSDETPNEPLRLYLAGDRVVAYRVQSNRLERVDTVGGESLHRDEFVFPAGSQISLQVSNDAKRVAVLVRQAARGRSRKTKLASHRPGPDMRFVLRFEATVGRDVRFVPIPATES